MKLVITFLLLLGLGLWSDAACSTADAQSQPPPGDVLVSPDLLLPTITPKPAGVYTVEGLNPDSKVYTGVLEVLPVEHVDGDTTTPTGTYLCRWTLADDTEQYGYGFMAGDQFTVAIWTEAGTSVTVAAYAITVDGGWVGLWSAAITGAVSTETLTPSSKTAAVLKQELVKRKPVRRGLVL